MSANDEFGQVKEDAQKIEKLVTGIAGACREQATALDQVSRALSDIEHGVQSGAATAEESSGASVEMRSQADRVHSEMLVLKAIVLGEQDAGVPATVPASAMMRPAPKTSKATPATRGAGAPPPGSG